VPGGTVVSDKWKLSIVQCLVLRFRIRAYGLWVSSARVKINKNTVQS